jgi:hypothetical protein
MLVSRCRLTGWRSLMPGGRRLQGDSGHRLHGDRLGIAPSAPFRASEHIFRAAASQRDWQRDGPGRERADALARQQSNPPRLKGSRICRRPKCGHRIPRGRHQWISQIATELVRRQVAVLSHPIMVRRAFRAGGESICLHHNAPLATPKTCSTRRDGGPTARLSLAA